MVVPAPPKSRTLREQHVVTFVVGGEEFQLQKPLLAIHSPLWAKRFETEPQLKREELPGEAPSFRAFLAFLRGAEGEEGVVSADNVLQLLEWGTVFQVDYVTSHCENFLLNTTPPSFPQAQLLDIACRYDMPLLYSRTIEVIAHEPSAHVEFPEERDSTSEVPEIFTDKGIREDILEAHLAMEMLRNDQESRRKQRFADFTGLEGNKQRARLLWKGQQSRPKDTLDDAPHDADWKASPLVVWPHHTLRDETWTVVAKERQPMNYRDMQASMESTRGWQSKGCAPIFHQPAVERAAYEQAG